MLDGRPPFHKDAPATTPPGVLYHLRYLVPLGATANHIIAGRKYQATIPCLVSSLVMYGEFRSD